MLYWRNTSSVPLHINWNFNVKFKKKNTHRGPKSLNEFLDKENKPTALKDHIIDH